MVLQLCLRLMQWIIVTEDADDQESEVTTGLSFDIEEFFDFSVEWNYNQFLELDGGF